MGKKKKYVIISETNAYSGGGFGAPPITCFEYCKNLEEVKRFLKENRIQTLLKIFKITEEIEFERKIAKRVVKEEVGWKLKEGGRGK